MSFCTPTHKHKKVALYHSVRVLLSVRICIFVCWYWIRIPLVSFRVNNLGKYCQCLPMFIGANWSLRVSVQPRTVAWVPKVLQEVQVSPYIYCLWGSRSSPRALSCAARCFVVWSWVRVPTTPPPPGDRWSRWRTRRCLRYASVRSVYKDNWDKN